MDRRMCLGAREALRPESFDPAHWTIQVDLKKESAFAICGIAVGALIQDGFSQPL